jgi:hypothetical protein
MHDDPQREARQVMSETCHCGSPMGGSDHCPDCMCEEMESWCDHVHVHVPEDEDEDEES